MPGTERWYIVYNRRPHGESAREPREPAIGRMEFDAQGHILPVKITHEGVAADPLR